MEKLRFPRHSSAKNHGRLDLSMMDVVCNNKKKQQAYSAPSWSSLELDSIHASRMDLFQLVQATPRAGEVRSGPGMVCMCALCRCVHV